MSYAKYCDVITQFCRLAGLEMPTEMYETAKFTMDKTSFTIMHGGTLEEESLIVFCDFGKPAEKCEDQIYRALLAANAQMLMAPGCEAFSVNENTGSIVLSSLLPIESINGESLLNVLKHYAAQVNEWHKCVDDFSAVLDGVAKMRHPTRDANHKHPATIMNSFSTRKQ